MGKEDVIGLQDLKSIQSRFTFKGKKGFVTGAAGGIGRTTAAAMAELGADVALVDIREDIAQENADYIAKKFGVKTMALGTDISDPAAVKEMFEKIISAFGVIDIVHSNAGISLPDDHADMSLEDWQKMIDVDYTSMFVVNQLVCQWMRDNKHPGSIVNTASLCGHVINRSPGRHMVSYTSTKAAILSLTKAMAIEFVDYGIRVNSVSPGYMYSGLHDEVPQDFLDALTNDVPMKRFGNMDEIGGAVVFLLSDLASYITGADLLIDGGYTIW